MDDLKVLIERSRSGDINAFGLVVERFQGMAIGYAETKVQDFHIAEEVAQESFIDAYLKLDDLKEAAAFPGWFRQIVRTHCNRVIRRRRIQTVPLEEGMQVTDLGSRRGDMHEEVLAALHALPEPQRVATTLFYINGYSQNEIAEFLDVPVTTVQKRLHDSRRKLKERMMTMVEETLKEHAADERFSQSVITELLMRPQPLEIEGHPVKRVAETLYAALPEYERVQGDEVVDKQSAQSLLMYPEQTYHVTDGRILRPETTATTFLAATGRTPPIRLLACGRVFRPDEEDVRCLKVFHQLDVLHIGSEVSEELMRATLRRSIQAVLGDVTLHYEPLDYAVTENGSVVHVLHNGQAVGIAGCGLVAPSFIERCGCDPRAVRGFSFGMGLERLSMIKYDIADIRSLWRAPYISVR